jgi:hypothetical protein
MVRQLAQVPPEIWTNLSVETKGCLLNEMKPQQQEGEKSKKSLAVNTRAHLKRIITLLIVMPYQISMQEVKIRKREGNSARRKKSRIMIVLMNYLKNQSGILLHMNICIVKTMTNGQLMILLTQLLV